VGGTTSLVFMVLEGQKLNHDFLAAKVKEAALLSAQKFGLFFMRFSPLKLSAMVFFP
jgi:hypothetical protein